MRLAAQTSNVYSILMINIVKHREGLYCPLNIVHLSATWLASPSGHFSLERIIPHPLHFETENALSLSLLLHITGLPTCTDFRGTYRFWPSITISRFHAVVYRFWKMREFLALADFVLFCFCRYALILSASCTYRQSGCCAAAINSPPYAMNQC